MNKGLLILNIILLVAVVILFFLFYNKKDGSVDVRHRSNSADTASQWQHTPVAYFDMDSVEANFTLFKKMQAEVVKREAGINSRLFLVVVLWSVYLWFSQGQET